MKKYSNLIVLSILQFCLFYIVPLLVNRNEAIAMVVMLLLGTFLLSILAGITKFEFKILYPLLVVFLFAPTIPIYYNFSAIVHIIWYSVISYTGLGIGMLITWIQKKITQKKSS